MEETKRCPLCNGIISAEAVKCNHCQAVLNNEDLIGDDVPAILIEVAANLLRKMETVSGRLQVTTKSLTFYAHSMAVKDRITEIPMSNIERLEGKKSLMFIPNRLAVILKSGMKYIFVVNKRDVLIDLIKKQMNEPVPKID